MLVLNTRKLDGSNAVSQVLNVDLKKSEVRISDVIMPYKYGEEDTSVTPDVVRNEFKGLSGDVDLFVNSRGGEMGASLEVYDIVKNYSGGDITCVVTGYAFSAAGWIPMAVPKERRLMTTGGVFMNHNPHFNVSVSSREHLESAMTQYDAHHKSIVNIFQEGTGLSAEEITTDMAKETFLSAEDAVQRGYFGGLHNAKPDLKVLNYCPPANLPEKFLIPDVYKEFTDNRLKRLMAIRKSSKS